MTSILVFGAFLFVLFELFHTISLRVSIEQLEKKNKALTKEITSLNIRVSNLEHVTMLKYRSP